MVSGPPLLLPLQAQNLPEEQRPVVLDLRNSYEWDAGHFVGAERPLEVRGCRPSDTVLSCSRA